MITVEQSLQSLLTHGGDERITLDAITGLNLYGHGPAPRPDHLAMGTSTASTISSQAYKALLSSHAALMERVHRDGDLAVYDEESDVIRARIQALLGFSGAAGKPSILLSPSGTDLHLLAATLLAAGGRPLLTITLEGSETGRGVGLAAAGRHFMGSAAGGGVVPKGLALGEDIQDLTLAVRDDAGHLISSATIERRMDAAIKTAIDKGGDCLLVLADVTKTGLIAPDLASVFRLKARYGARLWIMADACQLRISAQTIRAYLGNEMLVAITGSKFLGGPVFSGALLVPSSLDRDLSNRILPEAIGRYFGQGEFPENWAMRARLPERANLGLLLRWQAALYEWEALQALGSDAIAHVVQTFASAVAARLDRDKAFAPIATRPLDRSPLHAAAYRGDVIDTVPTIFPFLLARLDCAGERCALDSRQTRIVYERLAKGAVGHRTIKLGQPVAYGTQGGVQVSALRLCLGARMIIDACERKDGLKLLVAKAMHALDCTARAARDVRKLGVIRSTPVAFPPALARRMSSGG